ncbi:MAG TPA: TetR/AcrR family transcriptional regulator [Bryobacteraceae bacterium]|nr:TetR/AcrR family transcriptional regulator [Bryobacteraceae bacterium]
MTNTKTRILDTAERLFAAHGFEAASLRAITAEAGVNLAAVNYHFRSKEILIEAVITRRLGPINRRRLEMLDACEVEAGKRPPELEKIMEAFFAPVFEAHPHEMGSFLPLMGRMLMVPEQFQRQIFDKHFAAIVRRFEAALDLALPKLPPVERRWRNIFSIGAMTHTLLLSRILPALSQGLCDLSDGKAVTRWIVTFVSAGLRAPATQMPQTVRKGRAAGD